MIKRNLNNSLIVMAFLAVCCPFILGSCGQDYNSNTQDEIYGSTCSADASKVECDSLAIIKKNCIEGCHTTKFHTGWASFNNRAAFVSSGRIVVGNPDASLIITRLKNYGGTNSNMPEGGAPLPDADYQTLRSWVSQP